MSLEFVLPTVVGVALVGVMVLREWNLKPRTAVPLLTMVMAVAAAAAALVVFATAAGFLLGPARSSALTSWCRSIPLHHQVDPVTGVLSVAASAVMAARATRILRARRRVVRAANDGGRINVIEDEQRFAYAVPTRAGCVVVSTGLLESLSPMERRAVFAHERAHLRLRHHRYLLAAELSRSVLPFIRPLTRQLHHATERAADEAAVDAVAGERSIVATAIARAALGTPAIGTIPALGGGSVPRRLEALLWPEREARAGAMTSMVAACGGLVIVGAMLVQVHHFKGLLDHLCHGIG